MASSASSEDYLGELCGPEGGKTLMARSLSVPSSLASYPPVKLVNHLRAARYSGTSRGWYCVSSERYSPYQGDFCAWPPIISHLIRRWWLAC